MPAGTNVQPEKPPPPERGKGLMRPAALAAAFIGGWAIMALEMLAARKLAPYFGYSVYQWGALIGIVLCCLSAGYWIGGHLGDRPNAARALAWSLVGALVWTAATPALASEFVPVTRSLGPILGAVAASLLLVGPPTVLLAGVTPITAGLAARGGFARTAGTIYMISTFGSIGGTFFAAFYSIPELGSDVSYFISAALLALAGLAVVLATRRIAGLAVLVLAAALVARSQPEP